MPDGRRTRPLIARCLRVVAIALLATAVLATGIWASLAVNYSNLPWAWLRLTLAAVFAAGAIAVFILVRPWRRALLVYVVGFVMVLSWYYLTPPCNDRNWQPDVAKTPTVDLAGDTIVVHNVRNCVYRSETDFDVVYEDRSYDLSKLQSLDLTMSYWGPRNICHTMLTFVFEGEQYLCCSIETRKEVGESYSAVRGCFRQFELVYIFADERDVIGLRTDHRGEQVYMYHMPTPRERVKGYLLDYVRAANALAARPQWYNALTDSCSMGIIYHAWAARGDSPLRLRWLLNGYWDQYAYEAGVVDTSIPFETLRERSHINGRASSADADFSRRIRIGLPQALTLPRTAD